MHRFPSVLKPSPKEWSSSNSKHMAIAQKSKVLGTTVSVHLICSFCQLFFGYPTFEPCPISTNNGVVRSQSLPWESDKLTVNRSVSFHRLQTPSGHRIGKTFCFMILMSVSVYSNHRAHMSSEQVTNEWLFGHKGLLQKKKKDQRLETEGWTKGRETEA